MVNVAGVSTTCISKAYALPNMSRCLANCELIVIIECVEAFHASLCQV